jgi:hypothetical protein
VVDHLSARAVAAAPANAMNTPGIDSPDEPLPADSTPSLPAPTPGARARSWVARWPVLAGLAAFLLLAGLALVVSALVSRSGRPLYPNLPTFTPLAATLEGEPAVLTFTELNADPDAYRDQRIQVAGDFASVAPPDCVPYSGPGIRWSLVAEELQLNAVGFENVLRLVAEGTPMTVTGIWRLYRGPVGCGKEPPDANVWFLAVDQILEPNPLLGEDGAVLTVVPGGDLPTLPPLDLEAPTDEPTPTLEPVATEELPEAATLPPALPTIGATSTLPATPTLTPTLATTGLPGTPGTPGTPTETGTPTLTVTPGPSPTPSVTVEGGDLTPGIPTATQGSGYPGDPTPGYP